jgi:nickel/cobalt exporter
VNLALTSLPDLVQQSGAHAWLFIPSALLLGALHGLEPGHSKTMMAAFIVAIRGTIPQAALLAVTATISHTAVIWILAPFALKFGQSFQTESTEPYFQIASGVIIAGIAVWMIVRTNRERRAAAGHHHGPVGDGAHGGVMIDTGHGNCEVSIFETGVPPCFRLYFYDRAQRPAQLFHAREVSIETVRPDGAKQGFAFTEKGDFLESTTDIPEPHEFKATLTLAHGDHAHTYQTQFTEDEHHHHDVPEGEDFEDAHERAHAQEVQKRFANRNVTTGQLALFGLTGGLLPCPAAVTVLLLCLQLKRYLLGFVLVFSFSIGLALTLIAAGSLAAWGAGQAAKRFKGFSELAYRAPYFSGAILICMGAYVALAGYLHLR